MALRNKFFAKKSYGQHFLINSGIQQKTADACELSFEDTVMEIGPGKGAITKLLAPRVKKLVAVEKDPQLAPMLAEEMKAAGHVQIIHKDILDFSFSRAGDGIKIIGNLPYNIATPIIEKIILERSICRGFYFMVQKEYADRLVAAAGSKTYGSLSCFVQYYADVKLLFKISRGSFRPMPKVESAFCRCLFPQPLRYPAADEKLLFKVIHTAFSQRRKTVENALSTLIPKQGWGSLTEKTGIEPQWRPEQIPLKQFVELANELNRITSV